MVGPNVVENLNLLELRFRMNGDIIGAMIMYNQNSIWSISDTLLWIML